MQETLLSSVTEETPKVPGKEENKQEKKSTETIETKPESELLDMEQIDMSGMFDRNFVEIE